MAYFSGSSKPIEWYLDDPRTNNNIKQEVSHEETRIILLHIDSDVNKSNIGPNRVHCKKCRSRIDFRERWSTVEWRAHERDCKGRSRNPVTNMNPTAYDMEIGQIEKATQQFPYGPRADLIRTIINQNSG